LLFCDTYPTLNFSFGLHLDVFSCLHLFMFKMLTKSHLLFIPCVSLFLLLKTTTHSLGDTLMNKILECGHLYWILYAWDLTTSLGFKFEFRIFFELHFNSRSMVCYLNALVIFRYGFESNSSNLLKGHDSWSTRYHE
jgi:hypothetical protein